MNDGWHNIWSGKEPDINPEVLSIEELFMELKKLDGWDSVEKEITYSAFEKQYKKIKNELSFDPRHSGRRLESVFETGCGSAPMLLLFQNDGIKTGGMDYSAPLIDAASKVLKNPEELYCGEASDLDTSIKYDAVFSNSVFGYFPNEDYALNVLEKMYEKSNYSLGILDVYDPKHEDEFIKHRKSLDPSFEERYRDLHKLSLDKSFFIKFAERHHMDIRFSVADLEGYWNNHFVYDCFLTKIN